MSIATLTSKGQITLPVQVRNKLGVATGDRVEFIETEDGQLRIVAATHSVRELQGLFYSPHRKPVSIEEMNRAIAARGASAK